MDAVLVKTDISACFLLFNFIKHKQNKVNKKVFSLFSHVFCFEKQIGDMTGDME